jgi:hypothetical protein
VPTRNEARKALNRAHLPARDKFVYRALLDVADNQTLDIPDRFQPYRQSDNYVFGISRRTVQRALADLKLHGWISWERKQKVRQRGQWPNHYVLSIGWDCDCSKERQSDAVSDPAKSAGLTPNNPVKNANLGAFISARHAHLSAGQPPVLPKGVRDRGSALKEESREDFAGMSPEVLRATQLKNEADLAESMRHWPPGSEGEYANRWRP